MKFSIKDFFSKCNQICRKANRQLNGTNNYEQLNVDPTELHTEKIKSEINNLNMKTS